jgi:2-succinyl-5-enolpyruvyl-6-hydroxy-3-cyclohexene-1-carboxylate synthase
MQFLPFLNMTINTLLTEAENLNIVWALLIVEECVRNGVTLFCVSPGSRSTPLATAIARHPKAEAVVCVDERAAAFYALGYARATRRAAVLVCTSGTAVANYLPAVVEADKDAVPMLLLTADRPPELRETGANQTIQQPALFGDFVRWKFDIPCPDAQIAPEVVLTTVDYALARASSASSPSGAVHLNCMFREPLAPTSLPFPPSYLQSLVGWLQTTRPWTRYAPALPTLDAETAQEIASVLLSAQSPLFIVGRLRSREDETAVIRLASAFRVPIVPDIASGLRLGGVGENDSEEVVTVPYFDQMLLLPSALTQPDVVLHLGGSFVSKRLLQWLERSKPREYIVIDQTPFRNDPNHHVTMRVQADIALFAAGLTEHCPTSNQAPTAHIEVLSALSNIVAETLRNANDEPERTNAPMSEIAVATIVSRIIPDGDGLFLSNSMPIRDMDMYADASRRAVSIAIGTNRGASGIDGIIASTSGFARGLGRTTTLVIGDVAFIHDSNSLLLVAQNLVPLVIVLINNAGGGIFSFLPIAAHSDIFEQFWGTPHTADFQALATFAGLRYVAAQTTQDFRIAYEAALELGRMENRSTIIEVRTDRNANLTDHKHLQALIVSGLKEYRP